MLRRGYRRGVGSARGCRRGPQRIDPRLPAPGATGGPKGLGFESGSARRFRISSGAPEQGAGPTPEGDGPIRPRGAPRIVEAGRLPASAIAPAPRPAGEGPARSGPGASQTSAGAWPGAHPTRRGVSPGYPRGWTPKMMTTPVLIS